MDGRLEWTVLAVSETELNVCCDRVWGVAGDGGRCSLLAAVAATFAEQQILPCFNQLAGLSCTFPSRMLEQGEDSAECRQEGGSVGAMLDSSLVGG